jgi:hypothetical protein
MAPLALRDGAVVRGSYQEIERDESESRAHHFLLAVAHDLALLRMPELRAFGALSMTSIQFGSGEAAELVGKRSLEMGGSWQGRHNFAIGTGIVVPLGGDTFDGYRADRASSQLSLDAAAPAYPRSTAIRGKASVAMQLSNYFLRADGGLDMIVDTHGNKELAMTSSAAYLVRAGGAVGTRTSRFFFSAQLRALYQLGATSAQGRVVNTALSIEMLSFALRPAATLYIPLAGTQLLPGLALSMTYDLE